jgi:hypothetical protein
VGIARQEALVCSHHCEPGQRGRFVVPGEKSFGSGRPATHRSHEGSVEEQVQGDPDRRIGGGDRVSSLQARRMGSLVSLDGHIEMSRLVGELSKHPQVFVTEQPVRIGLG